MGEVVPFRMVPKALVREAWQWRVAWVWPGVLVLLLVLESFNERE